MRLCLFKFKLHDPGGLITPNKTIILEQWFSGEAIFPQGGLEIFFIVLFGNAAAIQWEEARDAFSLQCPAHTHNKEICGRSVRDVETKQSLQNGRCSLINPPGPYPFRS